MEAEGGGGGGVRGDFDSVEEETLKSLAATPKTTAASDCKYKQTVSGAVGQDPSEMRQNGPGSNAGQSVSPTNELTNETGGGVNNNKRLIKSDSGFSEEARKSVSGSAARQPVAIENVKAIYKSDSGYSEPGVVASSEDEDVSGPAKSKQPISVEEAHTLFNKRYAAMLLQSPDDPSPVAPTLASPKRPPNAIVEDSEEDSEDDDDETDDDSVEGSSCQTGSVRSSSVDEAGFQIDSVLLLPPPSKLDFVEKIRLHFEFVFLCLRLICSSKQCFIAEPEPGSSSLPESGQLQAVVPLVSFFLSHKFPSPQELT